MLKVGDNKQFDMTFFTLLDRFKDSDVDVFCKLTPVEMTVLLNHKAIISEGMSIRLLKSDWILFDGKRDRKVIEFIEQK